MKKYLIALTIIVSVSLLVLGASSWTKNATVLPVRDGQAFLFSGTLESTDTLTSNVFTLTGTNHWLGAKLSNGSNSTRKISVQVLGCWDNTNYKVIDTLMVSDSVSTVIDKAIDLNSKYVPYLKLIVFGTSGNSSSGTAFSLGIRSK